MTTEGHYANGKALAESMLEEKNMLRANVASVIKTIDDCGARGVPVSEKLAEALPIIAARLMAHHEPRMQATGAKLVQAAMRYNLDRFSVAMHEARLTTGLATENHGVIFELVEAKPPPSSGRVSE